MMGFTVRESRTELAPDQCESGEGIAGRRP